MLTADICLATLRLGNFDFLTLQRDGLFFYLHRFDNLWNFSWGERSGGCIENMTDERLNAFLSKHPELELSQC